MYPVPFKMELAVYYCFVVDFERLLHGLYDSGVSNRGDYRYYKFVVPRRECLLSSRLGLDVSTITSKPV